MGMVEGELTVQAEPMAKDDGVNDSLTNDQLAQKIVETVKSDSSGEPVQPVVPQPEPVVPAVPAPQEKPPEVPQVSTEQKQQEDVLRELSQKKGVKTPEEIAVMYRNLEKEFTKKSMEAAQLRKQVNQPLPMPSMPVQPQVNEVDEYARNNQILLDNINRDPINTLANMINFIQQNNPEMQNLRESMREQALVSEVTKLATNPKTADFTTPEITNEINTIVQERPQEAVNLEKNIRRLFYEARGRIQDKVESQNLELGKQIQQQTVNQKKAAGFDGTHGGGKLPVNVAPDQLPLDQLKNFLEQNLRNI